MPAAYPLGRRPPHPEATHPRLKLAPHLRALPTPPPAVDWYSRVDWWPMYANDRWGDCVFAEIGHEIQNHSTYGDGATVTIGESAVLEAYAAVTGFDPSDPATDRGTVIQDAMGYWRRVGVGGHRIAAFAEVDVRDLAEVRTAVHVFGGLSVGLYVPASAMDQFNRGEPWDVVRDDGGIEGGHCVELVGYDPDFLYVVTWGRVQRMTPAFWDAYVEEAWVPILAEEWVNDATGRDPLGLDLHGLGVEFAALTGEPNPFPAPAPAPTPPAPTPARDSPFTELGALLRQAIAEVVAWLDRHGL